MPINYQYEQSAAIYKILSRADEAYATWLHENGFQSKNGKQFKLFTYSRFKIEKRRILREEGRIQILSNTIEWQISFLPEKSTQRFIHLIEHINGNIHFQLFCDRMIPPSHPLTNYKIVSAIRQEIAEKMDIDSLQSVLAEHWCPYLDNLHVCMTDATCYESYMRHPTDLKLLWESVRWLYRHLCRDCRWLGIRRPRNKFDDVSRAYVAHSKKRKRKASRSRSSKGGC